MFIFQGAPEKHSRNLLKQYNLPHSDLESLHFNHFFGCKADKNLEGNLEGIVGLEIFESVALLRSLAVSDQARGRGYGIVLVKKAEEYATKNGVNEIYLLTTTAENFFKNLNYKLADRKQAPAQIKTTMEFSQLCPGSATLMIKKIKKSEHIS